MAFNFIPFQTLVETFSNSEYKKEFDKTESKKLSKDSRAHLALMTDFLQVLFKCDLDEKVKSETFTGCIVQIAGKNKELSDELLKLAGVSKDNILEKKDKNEAEMAYRRFRIANHIQQKSFNIPKFDDLVAVYDEAYKSELKNKRVDDLAKMDEPRKSQLTFLNNVLEVAKTKKNLTDEEKSLLLLGAMLKVSNEIKIKDYPNSDPLGSFWYKGSNVYQKFHPTLSNLDPIVKTQASMMLRNLIQEREAVAVKGKLEEKDISTPYPVMAGVDSKVLSSTKICAELGMNTNLSDELKEEQLPRKKLLEQISKLPKNESLGRVRHKGLLKKDTPTVVKQVLPKYKEIQMCRDPFFYFDKKAEPLAYFSRYQSEIAKNIPKAFEARDFEGKRFRANLFKSYIHPKIVRFDKSKLYSVSDEETPSSSPSPVMRRK